VTPEEFVAIIKQVVFDSSVRTSLLQPVGRKPHQVLVTIWDWYNQLAYRDQALVLQAMRIASYSAIFGFFAALDGARQIDNPPHGRLRLSYIGPDGHEQILNEEAADLHELWTGEVFPFTEPIPE
jgi:hypothetical protein